MKMCTRVILLGAAIAALIGCQAAAMKDTITAMASSGGVKVTTLAGSPGNPGSADGTGSAARFNSPYGLASDGTNLYVADTGNKTIRKIVLSTGEVSTLAGNAAELPGSADGTGSVARFNNPEGVTTDGTYVYVADSTNNLIRKILASTGAVTTIAGTTTGWAWADGVGSAASFQLPIGIAVSTGYLYVTDSCSFTVRQISVATSYVTTVAGTHGTSGSTDSPSGQGTDATFGFISGVVLLGNDLFVADCGNSVIRKVGANWPYSVMTLAGKAGGRGSSDGVGAEALFNGPWAIATDGTSLFVGDAGNSTIRKINVDTGAVTTIAGSPGIKGTADGYGSAARFRGPSGLAMAGGKLYVADYESHTIRCISGIQ